MNPLDDQILMRRVDGELSPDEARRVDAAAATDPSVANRLDALRRTRIVAADAFPIADDRRDRDLARLIASGPRVRPSPLAGWGRALADAFAPRRAALWGGLATAAFVGGLVISPLMGGGRPAGFGVGPDGVLADAGLVRVLDSRLGAEGVDADGRSVGLTFRDGEGRWCRTFQAARQGVAGLACRETQGWTMRALAPAAAPSGEIRVASADTPAPVLAAVDAAIAGETVDSTAEKRARDAGWR